MSRPSLVQKLSEVIWHEVHTGRTRNCPIGDKFEFTKAKLKAALDRDTLEEFCKLAATAIVEANTICHVSAIRQKAWFQNGHRPLIRDNDNHAGLPNYVEREKVSQ